MATGLPVRNIDLPPGGDDRLDMQFSASGVFEAQTIAASSTAVVIGPSDAGVGDFLHSLLVVPTSTSPGAITIADGTDTARSVFAGGASSVSNLVPFEIFIRRRSRVGAWTITTGANLSVQATYIPA